MSENRFFDTFSAWYYPGLVLAFFFVVGLPFGLGFGFNVTFDFVNLGIVLAILTYLGQYYIMPYALSEFRKDRAETARLERQEDSFASQAQSLAHEAVRLTHYNVILKQRMVAWINSKQLQMAEQRKEQEAAQVQLEQRSQVQMHNRYERELSYRSLCSALKKVESELAKKYVNEGRSQVYIQSLIRQLRGEQ